MKKLVEILASYLGFSILLVVLFLGAVVVNAVYDVPGVGLARVHAFLPAVAALVARLTLDKAIQKYLG